MKMRCRLALHNWGLWQPTTVQVKGEASPTNGQIRYCSDCGYTQVKKVYVDV